jgi:hypothetical protein
LNKINELKLIEININKYFYNKEFKNAIGHLEKVLESCSRSELFNKMLIKCYMFDN